MESQGGGGGGGEGEGRSALPRVTSAWLSPVWSTFHFTIHRPIKSIAIIKSINYACLLLAVELFNCQTRQPVTDCRHCPEVKQYHASQLACSGLHHNATECPHTEFTTQTVCRQRHIIIITARVGCPVHTTACTGRHSTLASGLQFTLNTQLTLAWVICPLLKPKSKSLQGERNLGQPTIIVFTSSKFSPHTVFWTSVYHSGNSRHNYYQTRQ